jgi:hypothetical protein
MPGGVRSAAWLVPLFELTVVAPVAPGEVALCLQGGSGDRRRLAHRRRAGRAGEDGGGADSARAARLVARERRRHSHQGAAHTDDHQPMHAHLGNLARMGAGSCSLFCIQCDGMGRWVCAYSARCDSGEALSAPAIGADTTLRPSVWAPRVCGRYGQIDEETRVPSQAGACLCDAAGCSHPRSDCNRPKGRPRGWWQTAYA